MAFGGRENKGHARTPSRNRLSFPAARRNHKSSSKNKNQKGAGNGGSCCYLFPFLSFIRSGFRIPLRFILRPQVTCRMSVLPRPQKRRTDGVIELEAVKNKRHPFLFPSQSFWLRTPEGTCLPGRRNIRVALASTKGYFPVTAGQAEYGDLAHG